MMEDLVRARLRVTGVVQGVGFRYFVRTIATELSIRGFVRNAPDGSVQVVAEGDGGMVREFIRQIRIGPRYAHIAGVDVEWLEPKDDFDNFEYTF